MSDKSDRHRQLSNFHFTPALNKPLLTVILLIICLGVTGHGSVRKDSASEDVISLLERVLLETREADSDESQDDQQQVVDEDSDPPIDDEYNFRFTINYQLIKCSDQ